VGALAATLVLISTAVAGLFNDGVAAVQRGDYATAIGIWHRLADQGDTRALDWLGQMYQQGWGVPQDYAAAVSWYRRAADKGDAVAQNNLGFMYLYGLGVPQDVAARMTPAQIADAQRLAGEWKPKRER